jgi:hypothetical protein
MKTTDSYHKWVEWSEEDGVSIGKCPDLISGIHGDDPGRVYADLARVVEESAERARLGRTGHLEMPDLVGVAARHRDPKDGGGRPAGTCRLEAAPAKIQA